MRDFTHCGQPLLPDFSCNLQPTDRESEQGIASIYIEIRQCKQKRPEGHICNKKHYYRQISYAGGFTDELEYLKPKHYQWVIADYKRRIKLGVESCWVWGFHPETFSKVKRTV